MSDNENTSRDSGPAREWLVVAGVAAATALCFLPALRNGFVFDDRVNIVSNTDFRGLSLSHLRWMFTTFFPGHYQPLTWVSLGLDYLVWGMNPVGYHLTNLVLHALNAVLVYFLLRALLSTRPGLAQHAGRAGFAVCCAAGALFFAVHPLRVESVAWATERRDVLSGLFFFLTLLAYLRMAGGGASARRKWYALSLVFFTLSLLSKAWAITLPAVLLALDVYPLRRTGGGEGAPASWRALLIEKVPFALLSLVFAVLALLAQKEFGMPMVKDHGVLDRLMQAAFGLCFYPLKTVAPVRLSALYLLKPWFDPWTAKHIACAVVVVAVTVWLMMMRRRWPWALCAWVCYGVVVSPVLGLAQSGEQIAADRYSYFACLPFAVLASAGLAQLWLAERGGKSRRALLVSSSAAVVLILAALTLRQIGVWHDEYTLWNHAVECDPENYVALYSRGCAFDKDRGEYEAALADYDAALALNADYAAPYVNRGAIREKRDDLAGALADYNRALELDPAFTKAYNNRGTVRRSLGDLKGALADYDAALRLDPKYAKAYNNRGSARRGLRDLKGALADYDAALRLNPDYAKAYVNRGIAREDRRDFAGAMSDYDAALRLDPKSAAAYCNRGRARKKQGDLAGALADYTTAIELDPGYADAYYNRAIARQAGGDAAGALSDYDAVIRLDPKHKNAYSNRGSLRSAGGDAAGALADYDTAIRLDPKFAAAYCNRGCLKRDRGDLAGAVRDFRTALALAPAKWSYRGHVKKLLAQALAKAGAGARKP